MVYQGGASASFFNRKIGCAPIHVAAEEGEPEKVKLLLKVQNLRNSRTEGKFDCVCGFMLLINEQLIRISDLNK